MRVWKMMSIAVVVCATASAGHTEVLVPPSAIEKVFVMTDQFVTLEPTAAAKVGYPVWQQVSMNGNVEAVPANWCHALLRAKPWLANQFMGTSDNPGERCWNSVTAVTADLNGIDFPKDVLAFWRTRPKGFEYWVPAFSVSQSEFVSIMGANTPATTFDAAPLVNKITQLEKRLSKIEIVVEGNTIAISDQQSALDGLRGRVEQLEKKPSSAPSVAPPVVVTEASLWGFLWWHWLIAVVIILLGLMTIGYLVRRRRWRSFEERIGNPQNQTGLFGYVAERLKPLTEQVQKQDERIEAHNERINALEAYTITRDSGDRFFKGMTQSDMDELSHGSIVPCQMRGFDDQGNQLSVKVHMQVHRPKGELAYVTFTGFKSGHDRVDTTNVIRVFQFMSKAEERRWVESTELWHDDLQGSAEDVLPPPQTEVGPMFTHRPTTNVSRGSDESISATLEVMPHPAVGDGTILKTIRSTGPALALLKAATADNSGH